MNVVENRKVSLKQRLPPSPSVRKDSQEVSGTRSNTVGEKPRNRRVVHTAMYEPAHEQQASGSASSHCE